MSSLGKHEIHLWLVSDESLQDPALLGRYQALLDQEELARHQRLRQDWHRRQFLVTRALVRTVLASYAPGMEPSALRFQRNAQGKPALKDFQGAKLNFNLSHSEGLVVLAVSAGPSLGVDVEYLTRPVEAERLARRYFAQQEVEALQLLEGKRQLSYFFDLWTLKEAYVKAHGMGLAIPLEDFCFQRQGEEIRVSFSPQREDDPADWCFWLFQEGRRHRLALAAHGKGLAQSSPRVRAWQGLPLVGFQPHPLEALARS